jgi:hypothetical protein
MAYTDIDDPSAYFQTKIYTGTGSSQAYTFDGNSDMQPDFLWFKQRNEEREHRLYDSVRGVTKYLEAHQNGAESTDSGATGLTALGSDGFTVVSANGVNAGSSRTYVAWGWKAGTSFTNDASATGIGSIDSTGSVNTDAGFSIVTYTGDGTNNDTAKFFHGLASAPNYIVIKCRSEAGNWQTSSTALGWNNVLTMDNTAAAAANTYAFGVSGVTPTSTVVTVSASSGGNHTNTNNATYVAYCFAEKQGYSKFGSYTGNGNVDGTFFYTGFKPAFTIIKSTGDDQWSMFDAKRNPFNEVDNNIRANSNAAEADQANKEVDYLSNGVKLRTSSGEWNTSGTKYIYMAFAENPFVTSTGVPACAR